MKTNYESYLTEQSITEEQFGRVVNKTNYLYEVKFNNKLYTKVSKVHNISEEIVVGDYVNVVEYENSLLITRILPRLSVVSKESSNAAKSFHEKTNEQILASNVNQIFILISADQRFTLGKLERYLMTFNQDDVDVFIVISKSDYKLKAANIKKSIHSVYPQLDIIEISSKDKDSINHLKSYIKEQQTVIFLGASGVGKSTLLNNILRTKTEETNEVRSDGKGRHTTTTTVLKYSKDTHSYIIDTPGFKTISTTREVDDYILFGQIYELANQCKFRDCKHKSEPGCRVKDAIETGELSEELYNRYLEAERVKRGLKMHEARKKRGLKR